MIRTVLTDVLLVGLEWKIAAPQASITFNSKKYQNMRKICIPLHKDDTSTNRDECAIVQSCTHE